MSLIPIRLDGPAASAIEAAEALRKLAPPELKDAVIVTAQEIPRSFLIEAFRQGKRVTFLVAPADAIPKKAIPMASDVDRLLADPYSFLEPRGAA